MEILKTLTPAQQQAVRLCKKSLDCFNSYDGTGLFTGMGRYVMLENRVMIAATQSRNLFEFWAKLSKKMLWPAPAKRHDADILTLMQSDEPMAVLKSLATETQSIIMLARAMHDDDKAAKKSLEQDEVEIKTDEKNQRRTFQ